MMESPCLRCTRVRDPQNCENKLCKDWQAWFIDRWETMRDNVRAEIARSPVQEAGVALGGRQYSSPHRVREFLAQDPCDRCMYRNDRCDTSCPTKLAWGNMRKEGSK